MFDRESFPELETSEFEGMVFYELDPLSEAPEIFGVFNLIFPSNLELLSIANAKFVSASLSSLEFPDTSIELNFSRVAFDDGYLHLGQNLEYVCIEDRPKIAIKSSFRIPQMAETFIF